MSASGLFGLVKNVSGILRELEAAGMHVEVGDDFATYRAYRSGQVDRGPVYPMFDVASSFVDAGNGFWICGFDPGGELIHTQAVRMLDLSDVTLGEHLTTHRHKYITPETTADPDATFYSGPEALEAITGRVCYHGDFWLRARGLGGPRSQGATAMLSRVLFELMVGSWAPDFVFALVPKQVAAKGVHLRYGYSHCEPGTWHGPDGQVTEEDYLIWMSAGEMAKALARPPQHLQPAMRVSAVPSPIASVDAKA